MTDSEETYGGPFTVDDGAGDKRGITRAAAARALAEPGVDLAKADTYWRNYAQRGYVRPYRRNVSANRPHFLYYAEQVLIAAVLIRMAEAGLGGDALFHKAAGSLGHWRIEDLLSPEQRAAGVQPIFPARNPASWVFLNYLAGQRGFVFELVAFRDAETGHADNVARVIRYPEGVGTDWHMPPNYARRSVWSVDLDPILAHLTREKGVLH